FIISYNKRKTNGYSLTTAPFVIWLNISVTKDICVIRKLKQLKRICSSKFKDKTNRFGNFFQRAFSSMELTLQNLTSTKLQESIYLKIKMLLHSLTLQDRKTEMEHISLNWKNELKQIPLR